MTRAVLDRRPDRAPVGHAGAQHPPQLKMRGFDGLRVCDSGVFPSLVGANTNAPTAMPAERPAT